MVSAFSETDPLPVPNKNEANPEPVTGLAARGFGPCVKLMGKLKNACDPKWSISPKFMNCQPHWIECRPRTFVKSDAMLIVLRGTITRAPPPLDAAPSPKNPPGANAGKFAQQLSKIGASPSADGLNPAP